MPPAVNGHTVYNVHERVQYVQCFVYSAYNVEVAYNVKTVRCVHSVNDVNTVHNTYNMYNVHKI